MALCYSVLYDVVIFYFIFEEQRLLCMMCLGSAKTLWSRIQLICRAG
uniref:Uncharacterized protein n=1 Tax=Arundo donax TaxID=35708 RepID=A0A0A9FJS2_ARUDO